MSPFLLLVLGGKLTDCQALLDAGHKLDGIYTIYPYQNDTGRKVFCDMKSDTGWIVIQRRYDGSVNFKRSLADYKDGFGSMDGEFWLGNEILHKLTDAEGNWTIRVDLTNEHNATSYVEETPFYIKPDDYTLSFGYSSTQRTVGRYCGHKLGMEDRSIPEDRITVSSHIDTYFEPINARLNLSRYWVPAEGQHQGSWLQVFMGTKPVQIEGVITQGHVHTTPTWYVSYVTHYQVQYSIDGTAWLYVNDGTSTPQTFVGNTDKDNPVTNIFKQPIQARYIRIKPTAWDNYPALRIELLGCRVDRGCVQSLGMEDGSIPDDRITPSSTDGEFCALNVKGRLNEFGGWCPTDSDKNSAWFQVDLQHIERITGVITKGNNNRVTWTTEFLVSHSSNSQYWTYIGGTSKANAQRFPGNSDRGTRVINMFNEEIRARFIRIFPTANSYHMYRPSMRVEFLGCNERWFCLQRLGMGDASIPDHSITASSTNGKVDGNCQPSNARLTQSANSNTIGWCPDPNDNNPWLQIDLRVRVLVEGIMMMQGSDQGTSVDTSYEYSDDQRTWHNVDSKQIIRTTTSTSEATSMFHPPITARYIRIVLSQTDGSLWIRIELLGCKVHWVCAQPLGMADQSIRNSQITASSYNQDQPISCKPSQGRLNLVNGGWCPSQVDRSASWLQVDLLMATPIEGVITQGINSNTLNWHVTSFQVEYSLNDNTWSFVSGHGAPTGQPQTFRGNTDQSTPVTNKFEQPIRGRFIRIRPVRYSGYPAMRIELIGCRSGILQIANNQAFSIHHHTDVNQDETNCPSLNTEGGWWFNRCSGIPGVDNNLNAEYIQPGDSMGPYKRVIRASEWNGSRIAKTEIKIRRQSPPRG
ncbi:uncharacterized protein [Asterias amurensis]|uniref:uncharacterized protein isoform X2 n=1 Tax=Asterias amurensis TaxID=7602 RepID=UPI003AB29799